jgi:menaquinol-cytochrome c reductase iron-sulfur subunit
MTRRRLLEVVLGAVATAISVTLAVPAVAFLGFPTRQRTVGAGDDPIDVGALDALPEGKPTRVTVVAPTQRDAWTTVSRVALGGCWLVKDGGDVRALSTVCPHAGCAVDWDEPEGAFVCPCHDSRFARSGERLSGPAPRPMDTLAVEVRDGRVRVAWRRFRTATPKKQPV